MRVEISAHVADSKIDPCSHVLNEVLVLRAVQFVCGGYV